MITMPFPPRRAFLLSFWSIMSLICGLSVGTFLAIMISPEWLILGIGISFLLTLTGLIWKRATLFAYRAWNKLAREYSRFTRQWLMFISYYVIFMVVGRSGSSLKLAKPVKGKSMWVPFKVYIATDHGNPNGNIIDEFIHKNWISAFFAWAKNSGNWWACCLLPFFMLISAIDEEEKKNLHPANIYTLF